MDEEKSEVKKEEPKRKEKRKKARRDRNQWRCEHGYLISKDGLYACSKCRE